MEKNKEPLSWDYFLTEYEKDLLLLTVIEAMQKYPRISQGQITADLRELMQNQEQFTISNGQIE